MKVCSLCLVNEATQKKSHILPKFLKNILNRGSNVNFFFEINVDMNQKKVQDLSWEDYILCPCCEKRISHIENYCAQHFFNRFHKLEFRNCFRAKSGMIKESLFLNMGIFNLFILSMIFRCSISNRPEFKNFTLPRAYQEKIRQDLFKNLLSKIGEYGNSCDKIEDDYLFYTIQTKINLSTTPEAPITACPSGEGLYSLFLGDYHVTLFLDPDKAVYKEALNKRNDRSLKIWLLSTKIWKMQTEKLYSSFNKKQ